jgi:hypothetical protein
MSAAHTPGPWIWADGHNGLFGAGPDNTVLEYEPYEGMWLGYERRDANARLIAAAPELLEALTRAADLLARDPKHDAAWKQARAAIAKATGGKQ